jgi:hypothetical protein
MKKLVLLLEKMILDGLISGYSIGGATALIYYFEPVQTQDIDVFILLTQESGVLVNLAPIYSFFEKHKCAIKDEYILVDGIPVQFLVPYNDLVTEAVQNSNQVKYGTVKVNLPPLEYLMAIMLQTNRLKDQARLEEINRFGIKYNLKLLLKILSKYKLSDRWSKLKGQFK